MLVTVLTVFGSTCKSKPAEDSKATRSEEAPPLASKDSKWHWCSKLADRIYAPYSRFFLLGISKTQYSSDVQTGICCFLQEFYFRCVKNYELIEWFTL